MKKRTTLVSAAALALAFASSTLSHAGEVSTGALALYRSTFKTVGAPGEIVTLPKCPTEVALFTPTYIYCPTGGCTIEANVSSEVSDVTDSTDSIRFWVYIDGSPVGVNPSINVGVQSTAHAGQIETATMSWMKKQLPSGAHSVEVKTCVNDKNANGVASAYAGDRTLTVRSYQGN